MSSEGSIAHAEGGVGSPERKGGPEGCS